MATLGKQLMGFVASNNLFAETDIHSREGNLFFKIKWAEDAESKINKFVRDRIEKAKSDTRKEMLECLCANLGLTEEGDAEPSKPPKQYDIQTGEEAEQKEAGDGN